MSYPNLPNNRLIVNGVDLTEKFKMVLADGYVLNPPAPKTYTVDIPGGNGQLDLTESLLGDTAYSNRTQEFTFYVINTYNFEQMKTRVQNFLHGKSFDYKMTMDPEYTYHGRFTVNSYEHAVYDVGKVGTIVITIEADPFKYKPVQVESVNAIAGALINLPSGRKRVSPIFTTSNYLRVIYKGKKYSMYTGSWRINDILLEPGDNEIYLITYDVRILTYGDLKTNGVTWGNLKKKKIFEWYKSNGTANPVIKNWTDFKATTWEDIAGDTWGQQMYKPESTEAIKNVVIEYEWGDL